MAQDELVVVYTTNGMMRAEIIKSKLESAGIPALLKYESAGPIYGLTIDGMGEVKVLVQKAHEVQARELLQD